MNMNYRKQYIFASAIQVVAIVLLVVLLIVASVYAEEEPPVNMGGVTTDPTDDPTGGPTDDPTEEPTDDPTEAPTEGPTEPPAEQISAVVNVSTLNIREAAHPSSRRVGYYVRGALIVILEQKTVSDVVWGRTNKGWICMSYVKVGATEPDPTEPPAVQISAVVNVSTLNIREAAHSSSRVVGYYVRGDLIVILEQKTVSGVMWGRTNKGWICMSYVKVGATEPDPTEPPTQPPTQPPTEPPTQPPTDSSNNNTGAGTLVENPFDRDDFVKNGYFISCKTEKTAIGVDVSRWQEKIDWERLKATGVDYVMIRAGFRGTGWAGTLVEDTYAKQHYEGAKAAGLKVGFYFFSQARTVEEAQEEARFLLDIVKDWEVDMPLACDWEYYNKNDTPRVYGLSRRRVTDCVKAFCETIKDAGYYPMVYAANYIVKEKLYMEELANYAIWFADYRNYLNSDFRVDMWQYTASGRVAGIKGNVDLNVLFLENSIFEKIFAED